jgi:hypothetical protein
VCDRSGSGDSGLITRLGQHAASGTFARPITVGSLFLLAFEDRALAAGPLLAMCDRCAMLSETAFDAHFRLVHEIALPRGQAPV